MCRTVELFALRFALGLPKTWQLWSELQNALVPEAILSETRNKQATAQIIDTMAKNALEVKPVEEAGNRASYALRRSSAIEQFCRATTEIQDRRLSFLSSRL
jgi:hypothetical protein